jgi:hypothetical protein
MRQCHQQQRHTLAGCDSELALRACARQSKLDLRLNPVLTDKYARNVLACERKRLTNGHGQQQSSPLQFGTSATVEIPESITH